MVAEKRKAASANTADFVPSSPAAEQSKGATSHRDDQRVVAFETALAYVMSKDEELLKRLA